MADLKLINMRDVEVESVSWLWYPFIPYGKVTIIQGDPGEGKTTLVPQIIARLTKGESIIDEKEKPPINVIYQTAEDGLADTIKPRLLSANADCSKVLVIDDRDTFQRLGYCKRTWVKNKIEHRLGKERIRYCSGYW